MMNDMFEINISPLQGLGLTFSISHGYVSLRHVLIHFGALPLLIKIICPSNFLSSEGTKCNNTGLPRVAEALAEALPCVKCK
jgi:hypothetical protein